MADQAGTPVTNGHPWAARTASGQPVGDGQLPPLQTTSGSETPLTPLGRAGQALKRLVFGPPLDVSAFAVERMRNLTALPVLPTDALSSAAYGPR